MSKQITISISNDVFDKIQSENKEKIGRSEFVEFLIRKGFEKLEDLK